MKKKFGRKIVALALTLTIALSLIPISAVSSSAKVSPETFDAWVTNQMYSRCLETSGSIIQTLGEVSGNAYIENFASFINCAYFNGSSSDTDEQISQLQSACNEILDTTKNVESVAHDINARIANDKITTNSSNCDNAWESQVMDYITKNDESPYDFYNVYLAYRNYLNYAGSASSIPSGKTIEDYEDKFIYELINYYAGKTNANLATEKDLYTTETIDICLTGLINSILNTMDPNTTSVGAGKRFIDLAAQYAYYAYPYSDEQAEFIDYATQYQINTITYLVMIYQDFLAHRAEYFKNNTDAENTQYYENIWERCYNKHYATLLDKYTTTIENFLNGDIYLKEIDAYTTLDQYVRTDSVSVSYDTQKNNYVLTNNKTIQSLNNEGETTNSTFTKNGKLSFYKNASVKAENGKLKFTPFYVLNGEALNRNYLNLNNFDIKIRTTQIGLNGAYGYCYDSHYFTPDYYNLKDGKFTDGINTYVPISNPNQLKNLVNETYFTANNSKPYSCFAPFLSYSEGKTNYLLLSGNTNWKVDTDFSSTRYTEMPVFNMSSSIAFSADWSSRFLNAGSFSDSTYSLILVPQSDVTKSEVDTKLIGEGDITVSGGAEATVVAGEKVAVKITAPENHVISKITATYQSNNNSVEKVLSTGLKENEFTFEYPVPYSNVTITAETKEIPLPLSSDENGNYRVSSVDDLCQMATMVNSGYNEYIYGSYVLTKDITFEGGALWSTPIGTTDSPFKGQFNGQGHTINFLHLDPDCENSNFGLFGTVVSGHISNLNLIMNTYNANVYHKNIGTVCGYIENGSISNCVAIVDFCTSSKVVGGIVGTAKNSVIKNCKTELSIFTEKTSTIGDICGVNDNCEIIDCKSNNVIYK